MEATDRWDNDVYVDYYLLGKGEVGRVTYDAVTGEFVDGEVLSKSGQWCKFPVNMILRDATLLTPEEAEKYAGHVCGQIQE